MTAAAGRLLREPLLVFLAVGVAIFAGYGLRDSGEAGKIVLTAATHARLVEEFEALTGRAASAADVERLERDFVTDAMLLRAGLERGLHLTEPDIREAVIERMRREITGPLPEPAPAALVNYYAAHIERYYTEPAISFEQVYFLDPVAAPAELLARLRAGEAVAGDAYWQGERFPAYGESMIRGIFGQPFLEGLRTAPTGGWVGPLQTPRGQHFVRVSERHAPRLLSFEQARGQVTQDYLVEQIDAAVAAWREGRRSDYVIEIER